MADILQCPARGSALCRPSTPTLSVSTFRVALRDEGWPRQEPPRFRWSGERLSVCGEAQGQ